MTSEFKSAEIITNVPSDRPDKKFSKGKRTQPAESVTDDLRLQER
jgi:hypothetical protein